MNQRLVAVFGSSTAREGGDEWETAFQIGGILANSGFGVITGGYGGVMEGASAGCQKAGGRVVGVVASALFPDRPGPNRYVDEVADVDTIPGRIEAMTSRSVGSIVLPGSVGTAAELLMAWNIDVVKRGAGTDGYPTVTVGRQWAELLNAVPDLGYPLARSVHTEDTAIAACSWLLAQIASDT